VAHCRIPSLALGLMMSSLLLAYCDPQLFFIHFYESLIYLVIVAMLSTSQIVGLTCLVC